MHQAQIVASKVQASNKHWKSWILNTNLLFSIFHLAKLRHYWLRIPQLLECCGTVRLGITYLKL